MKERDGTGRGRRTNTLTATYRRKKIFLTCHYCRKPGHMKRNCLKMAADLEQKKDKRGRKEASHKAHKTELDDVRGDSNTLLVCHAWAAQASS